MSRKPTEEIHREVVDQLNGGLPSEDRSILVTQTVYATIRVLKEHGFIDTEELPDAESPAAPHE